MQFPAQKSLKRESKLDQNSNTDLTPKKAIRHSWSVDWPKVVAWPEDPLIKRNLTFFDFLEIRMRSNSYLISLKHPNLYKQSKQIKIKDSSLLTFQFPLR